MSALIELIKDLESVTQRTILTYGFLSKWFVQEYMSDAKEIDSPPLSEEEITDIDDFYAHPEEHETMTVEEFIKELHDECKSD